MTPEAEKLLESYAALDALEVAADANGYWVVDPSSIGGFVRCWNKGNWLSYSNRMNATPHPNPIRIAISSLNMLNNPLRAVGSRVELFMCACPSTLDLRRENGRPR